MLTPYTNPIEPIFYPLLAFLFCVVGLAFLATFIVSEITPQNGGKKNIFQELTFATITSTTLGLGLFFVLLAGGIYV
ncbi:hypothetical protein CYY_009455 [Polysphondylium violaceum]|uniref:Dolichyl-diphosphooligosaccharide-protein glycosyltransferase subunit OST5 n=1 Tax=Polysphondylium violaceum TaxID=133409 RepID=A0A8J4PLT1_9MYCE|nr:hypothetical protein CYY_009455 [Polysphondylium violaceum]